ncbi:MAG: putative sulfate exporter family transporter [Bacillota bacterium]|nr:putative sulfate exporter family transporter [Bacillota bacterium]
MARAATQAAEIKRVEHVAAAVQTLPGLALVVALAVAARYADSWLHANYGTVQDLLHLNYVILAIVTGIAVRNTIGVPAWCEEGLKYSTVFTKVGIVLMGTKYTLASLGQVGLVSMIFITVFLFGTVGMVYYVTRWFRATDSLSACLASGLSVCGVSAIVATGPAVKAKNEELAYAIATILIFGLGALFTFPFIGKFLHLTPEQFGSWAGVGIVNSAQVLAAGFAYSEQAGIVAGIYNLGRVVLLPFVVLAVVMVTLGRESASARQQGREINKWQFIYEKFPVFILAFFLAVLLNTAGVFTKPELSLTNQMMIWAFALGFASIGLNTRLSDLRAAGKDGLILGFVVGAMKAALALLVVLYIL